MFCGNGETSPAFWEPGSQEARRQTLAAAVGWRDAQRCHAQRRAGKPNVLSEL